MWYRISVLQKVSASITSLAVVPGSTESLVTNCMEDVVTLFRLRNVRDLGIIFDDELRFPRYAY